MKQFLAEFTGTFALIFIGCGTVVFSLPWTGYTGISCAFGFTLASMMFLFGDVSGGHFNPAITLSVAVSGQFSASSPFKAVLRFLSYLLAQTLGAFTASFLLHFLYFAKKGFVHNGTFGANVYTQYPTLTVFIIEAVLTAFMASLFLKTTQSEKTKNVAPFIVGLFLTAISFMAMPVSFAGFNPAKSASQVIFGGKEALAQLPLFIIAPLTGGFFAGLLNRFFKTKENN